MSRDYSRRNLLKVGLAAGAAGTVGSVLPAAAAGTASPSPEPAAAAGPAPATGNPFLEGAFRPSDSEVTAFDLPVTGRIPADLDGRYLRNGPNALGIEDPLAHHWLMGEGMVHGVRVRDGRAEWYRSRWVRSASVAEKLGEPYRNGTPSPADWSSSINVIGHRGRTLALQEGTAPVYELTDELYTVGPYDFGGTLNCSFTAHTKLDQATGELHSVSYDPSKTQVEHVVVDASGKVSRTNLIEVGANLMMHDFALTERYVVVYDQPIVFDPDAMNHGQKIPWVWDDRRPHRVGVMRRSGGPVRWLPVQASFVSHTLNAYDSPDGKTITVDFVAFPAPYVVDGPRAVGTPRMDRWTIDLDRGRVAERRLDDRPQEFPRINEQLVGRPNRYGYSAAASHLIRQLAPDEEQVPDDALSNGLIKHDLRRGRTQFHRFERDATVGEAVFVPRAGATTEDDGYVISYVHNPQRGASDLVILSAADFTAKPLARIHLPRPIPLGLHGSWVPAS